MDRTRPALPQAGGEIGHVGARRGRGRERGRGKERRREGRTDLILTSVFQVRYSHFIEIKVTSVALKKLPPVPLVDNMEKTTPATRGRGGGWSRMYRIVPSKHPWVFVIHG